jgi:DNA-binding MarR family transcriptional regulator
LIKQAFHYTRRAVDDAVRRHGVSAAQWGVLNRLADQPGLSGADLARQMLITPQAAQLALSSLEDRGLVERRPDPNHGRILRAHLTPEGKRLADVCQADAHAIERDLIADFDPDERRAFTEFLLRYMRDSLPAQEVRGGTKP